MVASGTKMGELFLSKLRLVLLEKTKFLLKLCRWRSGETVPLRIVVLGKGVGLLCGSPCCRRAGGVCRGLAHLSVFRKVRQLPVGSLGHRSNCRLVCETILHAAHVLGFR